MLRQLARSGRAEAMPAVRPAAILCMVVLFLSGGYLAGEARLWDMAWPKAAVAIIIAFGALGAVSGRRMGRAQELPLLRTSLSIRTGLLLAVVWLMTAKPGTAASIGVPAASIILFGGLAALARPRTETRRAAAERNFGATGR